MKELRDKELLSISSQCYQNADSDVYGTQSMQDCSRMISTKEPFCMTLAKMNIIILFLFILTASGLNWVAVVIQRTNTHIT
jgi:hypothetical protein